MKITDLDCIVHHTIMQHISLEFCKKLQNKILDFLITLTHKNPLQRMEGSDCSNANCTNTPEDWADVSAGICKFSIA